jgi:cytochrome c oxidase cbb3-type subunit 1
MALIESRRAVVQPEPPPVRAKPAADDSPPARWFFYSAVGWLMLNVTIGIVLSIFLYTPAIQRVIPEALRDALNFGRLRPAHVGSGIFGWISMSWAGAMLYITPRLLRTRLFSERLAWVTLALWNAAILGAVITIPLGYSQGREYAEFPWLFDIMLTACLAMLAVNLWGTIARRTERRIYVSVWLFAISASVAVVVYAVGNKIWDFSGSYTGLNDAIIQYFYIHNLFNAWFTTSAFGIVFFLLPRLTGNPLFSHRLAMWGFTSVWTGQHHALWSPAPDWLEITSVALSILAIIPNAALAYIFFKTMQGKWHTLRDNLPLRWLSVGVVFYLFTCVQGIAQSFRTFSAYIHFTNWTIGHSHLAFVADYSFFAFALATYLLPRMLGRPLAARRAAEWHFWATFASVTCFMYVLWFIGILQADAWAEQVPFLETVRALKPWFFVRLLAGAALALSQLLFLYVVIKTARRPRPGTDDGAAATALAAG